MSLVDWELAERVAVRVASKSATPPVDPALGADFDELTARAEHLVAEATGLHSAAGPARARVVDRADWVRANLVSFERLLRPLTDKLADRTGPSGPPPLARRVAAVEVGALLGWMSGRVLGQYDLLVIEEEAPHEQDLVYYVGPNVVALEQRFGFPARDFRLWLALHEVTHRAQFTGVPWLREHFLGLVHEMLDAVDPDPKRFLEALRGAVAATRARRNGTGGGNGGGGTADGTRAGGTDPLDGGLVALLATPRQRELLDRISGMMSLLEGHGDVTMNRAGQGQVEGAARFARVLAERRRNTTALARTVQRLVGIEAKLAQYEQGERFIEAVEREGGPALLARAWQGPECLPTLAEVRDPARWVARIRSRAA